MENPPNINPLEAKVRVLQSQLETSEKNYRETKEQLNRVLEVLQKLEFSKLVTSVEARLDRLETKIDHSKRHTREELAGRLAVMLEPYLTKMGNRLSDFDAQLSGFEAKLAAGQKSLEKTYAAHREKLAADSAVVVNEFENRGHALIENWNNAQRAVQANLNKVNEYAETISGKIASVQQAQSEINRVSNDFAKQMDLKLDTWSRMTSAMAERLENAQNEAYKTADDASLRNRIFHSRTVGEFKSLVFVSTIGACLAILVCAGVFGALLYNRAANVIEQVKDFSDKEKQSIERIFAESVKSADLQNTDDQMRLKTYQFLLNRLPAKYRKDFDAELKTQFEQIKNERSAKLAARPQIAELTDKK